MAPKKRNPLDEARKRVQEKLNSVQEQSDYICGYIQNIVETACDPAQSLLKEKDKSTFFNKYSSVSQELEKCLDTLLVISSSFPSFDDSFEEDEDNKGDTDSHCSGNNKKQVPNFACVEPVDWKHDSKKSAVAEKLAEKSPDSIVHESTEKYPAVELTDCSVSTVKESHCNAGHVSVEKDLGDNLNCSVSVVSESYKDSDQGSTASGNLLPDIVIPQSHMSYLAPFSLVDYEGSVDSSNGTGKSDPSCEQLSQCGPLQSFQFEKPSQPVQFATQQPSHFVPSQQSQFDSHKPIQIETHKQSQTEQYRSPRVETHQSLTLESQPPYQFGVYPSQIGTQQSSQFGIPHSKETTDINILLDTLKKDLKCYQESSLSYSQTNAERLVDAASLDSCNDKSESTKEGTSQSEGDVGMLLIDLKKGLQHLMSNRFSDSANNSQLIHQQEDFPPVFVDNCQSSDQDILKPLPIPDVSAPIPVQTLQGAVVQPQKRSKTPPSEKGSIISDVGSGTEGNKERKGNKEVKKGKKERIAGKGERTNVKLEPLDFQTGCCMEVIVTEVTNPVEFWIQVVDEQKLDELMEEMCMTYSKQAKLGYRGGLSYIPETGEFVCGKFTHDDIWYRAKVLEIKYVREAQTISPRAANKARKTSSSSSTSVIDDFPGIQVTVLCVDDGNKETLPLSRLRPIEQRFGEMQCQAVCCSLAGIQPLEGSSWSEESISWFKDTVAGKTLKAIPCVESSNSSSKTPLAHVLVNLLCGTSTVEGKSTSIAEMMVEACHAQNIQVIGDAKLSNSHKLSKPLMIQPPVIPISPDGSLYMIMSHIVNPGKFYVNIVSPDSGLIDDLMRDMNFFYGTNASTLDSSERIGGFFSREFHPQTGDYCCARFVEDNKWYRAQVMGTRETMNIIEVEEESPWHNPYKEEQEYHVFYADYGGSMWVSSRNLAPLLPRFTELPAQAVICCLADIQPFLSQDNQPRVQDEKPFLKDVPKRSKASKRLKNGKKISLGGVRVVAIAAGDEGTGSDHSSYNELTIQNDTYKQADGQNNTTLDMQPSLPPRDEDWSQDAVESLRFLTDHDRQLVGYIVPWDHNTVAKLSIQNGASNVLCLNLYDTTGDTDVFINQELVNMSVVSSHVLQPQTQFLDAPDAGVDEVVEPTRDITSPTSPDAETEALEKWDPMAEDFGSRRNAYNIDTDNAVIAIQGHDLNSEDRICRFFNTKSGCWRASRCPNAHVKEGEGVKVDTFCTADTDLILPEPGSCVAVQVTAVKNPARFTVQLTHGAEPLDQQIFRAKYGQIDQPDKSSDDDLNSLMERMQGYYNKLDIIRERSVVPPQSGELVVAKYLEDNRWYRARVIDHDENNAMLQVYFVDYGNSQWILEDNVKRILPHFTHLPFQAVECILANVEPPDAMDKEEMAFGWPTASKEVFESLTEDKVLIAHVLSRGVDNSLYINLYDTENETEVLINDTLVETGLAKQTEKKLTKMWKMDALAILRGSTQEFGYPG